MMSIWLWAEATIAVTVVLLLATTLGLPDRRVAPLSLLLPLPFVLWRMIMLSVTVDGPGVVVRNPWRTYRVQRVVRLHIGSVHALKGMGCLAFEGEDGRVVKGVATVLWHRGLLVDRAAGTIVRLDDVFGPWAEAVLPRSARTSYLGHWSLSSATARRHAAQERAV